MLAKVLAPFLFLLASSARAAKTDLAGCTLTSVPLLTAIVTTTGANGVVGSFGDYDFTTFQWDGTEQCQLLDCGGGRAPPKTNAPGCPGYTGTDTVPSLPFPTASLTLNQAAATTPAAAGASSAAAGATASPAATNTGAPAATPSSANAGSAAASGTPSPTVTTSPVGSGSGSAASDLNPTSTGSNGARRLGGRLDEMLVGLVVVAAAALPFV